MFRLFRNKFLKDNFLLAASSVIGGLLGFLFHAVVARNLSIPEYGKLQVLSSMAVIFSIFASSLSYFIIKYSSVFHLHDDRRGQADFVNFLFRKFAFPVAGGFAVYLLALPIVNKFLNFGSYTGLVGIGLSSVVFIFASFIVYSIQGWQRFAYVALLGVSVAFFKLVGGWVLSLVKPDADWVVYSIFISNALLALMAGIYFKKKFRKFGKGSDWREKYFGEENFRKSFTKIFWFSLALAALGNLDLIVIKNLVSPETVGYYGALSILGKSVFVVNLSVVNVSFPGACSLGYLGKPADVRYILGSYGLIVLASGAAILFFILIPQPLITLLFGTKYVIYSNALWLFGLASFFFSIMYFEASLAVARRDYRVNYILGLATAILISGIYLWHATIPAIISVVAAVFFSGWLWLLFNNLKHRQKHDLTSA